MWREEKMAEPLKDMYNQEVIQTLAEKIKSVDHQFNDTLFIQTIFAGEWKELALKQRMRKITLALGQTLPNDYLSALHILLTLGNDAQKGLFVLFPDFVEVYGQDHWEESVAALAYFTKGSTSEFAVRPFLKKDPERMMKQMHKWALDEDEHVRRLASEGCRPRLPWGEALTEFKKKPEPVIDLLEKLKKDPSKYVRKSVANNLNDLSKDHPYKVLQIAKGWQGQHDDTDWIIRHGCRGLLRLELPEAYALFGYVNIKENPQAITDANIKSSATSIRIGDSVDLHWNAKVEESSGKRIRFEYAIDFVKANGKTSRKKFLLIDRKIFQEETLQRIRTHRFADLSTRKHYAGLHTVTLLANGVELASATIELS